MRRAGIARGLLGGLMLALLAAAYMHLGLFVPINWSDEGIIVYPSWRVAEGALPYREFHHLYAPSVFFLNGFLLRVFGPDLEVVRYGLLVVKSSLCVTVYLAARGVANRFFALFAFALAVVTSGLVWPVSTVPYPNTFAMALCLAGLLSLLAAGRRLWLGCALAGLCFGLAMTFKQTTGAFAFLGVTLFLLFPVAPREGGESSTSEVGPFLAFLVRASRVFVLGFTLCLVSFYLIPGNSFWNALALGAPILALWLHLVGREWRTPPSPASRLSSFWAMLALSLGFVAAPLGYAIDYVSLGLGSAILFDTLVGLPGLVEWMVPLPTPDLSFGLWMASCLGGFGAAALWSGRSADGLRAARRMRGVRRGSALALLAVSILASGTLAWQAWILRDATWWFWGPADLLSSLPFIVVVAGLIALFRRDRAAARDDSSPRDRAFRLWICHAPLALMWLFPAADIWHRVMVLPSFLPLLAWLLDRFWQSLKGLESEARFARAGAIALLAVVCLVLLVPPVHDVLLERGKEPAFEVSLPRATGVRGGSVAMTRHGGDMVRYLVEPERRDVPVLVLSAKPLFYFLTDHISPLEEFDFTLYLAAIHAIPGHLARSLADENEMIRRIAALHPLILDDSYDRSSKNIRDAFPRLAHFIRSNYAPDSSFGRFRVLRWRSESDGT